MENHCAVRCPVVTEAVKAATPEHRISMAIAAIESEKISERLAADRFGVDRMTLSRRRQKAPGGSSDPPGASAPKATKGKDGKKQASAKATPEEIVRAWQMRDSGMSTPAIAKDLGRGNSTVREWFTKERPEAVQAAQPPAPDPVSQVRDIQPDAPATAKPAPPSPFPAPALRDPSLPLPALSVELIKREKKAAPKRATGLATLSKLNADMERHWRAAQRSWEKDGRSVLRNHKHLADEELIKSGTLAAQCEALGLSPDANYQEMLRAIDAAAKKLSQSARTLLYLYGFTDMVET